MPANDSAHLPGRCGERRTEEGLQALRVRCIADSALLRSPYSDVQKSNKQPECRDALAGWQRRRMTSWDSAGRAAGDIRPRSGPRECSHFPATSPSPSRSGRALVIKICANQGSAPIRDLLQSGRPASINGPSRRVGPKARGAPETAVS